MFDYHLHSSLSFDSTEPALNIAQAALRNGLQEICFTDHYDYNSDPSLHANLFTTDAYAAAYDSLSVPGLTIRQGVELGLARWNAREVEALLQQRHFDFAIGSVHFVDGHDPYEAVYWEGRTVRDGFVRYLDEILACVKVHDCFDVLGHINYACKFEPTGQPMLYKDHREAADEIMKLLVQKGKGMEINTSGVDRAGTFLPGADYLKRFKELGGEIVTVGSDAHNAARVGQYVPQALEILKDIFGHICTFADRKPVFHKL